MVLGVQNTVPPTTSVLQKDKVLTTAQMNTFWQK